MALFTAGFRKRLWQSAESFLLALLFLAFAVALSFVKDFLVEYHRPEWLIWGTEGLEILLFITDAVVLGALCFNLLWIELKELWRKL